MHLRKQSLVLVLVGMFLLAMAPAGFAETMFPPTSNLLADPGFESGGLVGWTGFGNHLAEVSNPPAIDPLTGLFVAKLYGNWSGPYNVSGIFQEFATTPGQTWEMSSNARFWSGDPLTGTGAPNANWVVQKLAWFDASNAEIGGAESVILDGSYAPDTWHASGLLSAVAPPATVKVQALILFIQPASDGGAALIDDVYLRNPAPVSTENSTWGKVKALYR